MDSIEVYVVYEYQPGPGLIKIFKWV